MDGFAAFTRKPTPPHPHPHWPPRPCCSVESGRGGIPTRAYLLLDVKAKAVARHGTFAHIQELKAKDKQVWQDILQVGGCGAENLGRTRVGGWVEGRALAAAEGGWRGGRVSREGLPLAGLTACG